MTKEEYKALPVTDLDNIVEFLLEYREKNPIHYNFTT